MPTLRHRFHLLLPLASLACGGSDLTLPTDAPVAQVEVVQGDEQEGAPGAPLQDPLIVRVTDSVGSPLPGQAVTWSVSGGGGAIDPVAASSNSEGLAFAEWILGPSPGLNLVEAQVAGSDAVTFTARAKVGGGGGGGGDDDGSDTGPAHLEPVEGTGQSAEAGSQVAVRPAVLVTDSAGEPVAGVAVTFVVTAGGGSVGGTAQTTGSDGIARVDRWTLGVEPGANTLEARSGSLEGSPVIFTAVATAPAPQVDRLIYRFPPPQRAKMDQPFAVKVALVDVDGDVVPLDGILIYLGLFPEGSESPTNQIILGSRFESTVDGFATFQLAVTKKGKYRLRALTDDLPELGPHGPEPWLYSYVFEVK